MGLITSDCAAAGRRATRTRGRCYGSFSVRSAHQHTHTHQPWCVCLSSWVPKADLECVGGTMKADLECVGPKADLECVGGTMRRGGREGEQRELSSRGVAVPSRSWRDGRLRLGASAVGGACAVDAPDAAAARAAAAYRCACVRVSGGVLAAAVAARLPENLLAQLDAISCSSKIHYVTIQPADIFGNTANAIIIVMRLDHDGDADGHPQIPSDGHGPSSLQR